MADQSQASDFSDVFISYRRKDVEFVKELVAGIQATGKEVWVDWEDIPPGSVGFTDDIQRGLEGSDAFIAVLSPDYLESEYCVELELQTAINLNKRIIPVVYRKFDGYDIPLGIGHINWIYFTPHAGQENTYEESLPKVLHALEADFEHMRAHKRFLLRAIEWDKNERRNSFLLTGDEINEAEEWLSDASGKDPVPNELHGDYIIASRQLATKRQRTSIELDEYNQAMPTSILTTKLYIPTLRSNLVVRPRLFEQLNESLQRKLTLVSAPAGFGKTTLVSAWARHTNLPITWISLDETENDSAHFLAYFVAALKMIHATMSDNLLITLQSPQLLPIEATLVSLLNELASFKNDTILVLDDYHVIDSEEVNHMMSYLLDHLPPHIHLIMTTREYPPLPLARLRANGDLVEIQGTDLRFTSSETTRFINEVMQLDLGKDDIAKLEKRTEGWAVGLQLAAISMENHPDKTQFINSFSGSHQYVLDYLLEEVFRDLSEDIQDFLLHTAILGRLCGTLCDAVLVAEPGTSQPILEYLEQANLFTTQLDHERNWFRYHRLFRDLLKQKLARTDRLDVVTLHQRASQWYESHGFEQDAFHHASQTNDINRTLDLIKSKELPLYYRGGASAVVQWLETLPSAEFSTKPELWVIRATTQTVMGRTKGVIDDLDAAERALAHIEETATTRDLLGQIASVRAISATTTYASEKIISHSQYALANLHPDNLAVRILINCVMGVAFIYEGKWNAARDALMTAITMSERSQNTFINLLASTSLGLVHEANTQLNDAKACFDKVRSLAGNPALPIACEAFLGLSRIYYQWNDLDKAHEFALQGIELAQQIETIDSAVAGKILLAHIFIVTGDIEQANNHLSQAEQAINQHNFLQIRPDWISARIRVFLAEGDMDGATSLLKTQELPLEQARILVASHQPTLALPILRTYLDNVTATNWEAEQLKALILLSLAYALNDDHDQAQITLSNALNRAKAGGYLRLFLDEGLPMEQLLSATAVGNELRAYAQHLLDTFSSTSNSRQFQTTSSNPLKIEEPLSDREIEILHYIAEGLTNREIASRLHLSLHTVKVHAHNIYGKLDVRNRTEAVTKGRLLRILPK
jgi:LuxR family maltose regulon positive regulatory protein